MTASLSWPLTKYPEGLTVAQVFGAADQATLARYQARVKCYETGHLATGTLTECEGYRMPLTLEINGIVVQANFDGDDFKDVDARHQFLALEVWEA